MNFLNEHHSYFTSLNNKLTINNLYKTLQLIERTSATNKISYNTPEYYKAFYLFKSISENLISAHFLHPNTKEELKFNLFRDQNNYWDVDVLFQNKLLETKLYSFICKGVVAMDNKKPVGNHVCMPNGFSFLRNKEFVKNISCVRYDEAIELNIINEGMKQTGLDFNIGLRYKKAKKDRI